MTSASTVNVIQTAPNVKQVCIAQKVIVRSALPVKQEQMQCEYIFTHSGLFLASNLW